MSERVRALAFALCLGCANLDTGTAALRDAASALDCPRTATEVEQLGEYRYRGRGCGGEVIVACTSSSFEPRCFPERAAAATAGDEEESSAPPDVERAIRNGLDARRADVLGCVGSERVGVRAAYDSDGRIVLSLQGDLAGSPEETCVREALAGVRVPAARRDGVLVHLVR